jgi:hypothetical protein
VEEREFVAPEVAPPEDEAAVDAEASPAVEEKEQVAPVEEAATGSVEAPESLVEEKAAEVGPEMELEAPTAFVHEAAPVVAEKDVPTARVRPWLGQERTDVCGLIC